MGNEIVNFLIQIGVMLFFALICRKIASKVKFPIVISEIISGIVLGPSILGNFAPDIYHEIFLVNYFVLSGREILTTLGLLFFLFVTGTEINLKLLKQQKNKVFLISFLGMIIPFAFGIGIAILFPNLWRLTIQNRIQLTFFIGVALSISALPVIARTLVEFRLLKTKIGMLILSAATIDDMCGWVLFSIIAYGFNKGHDVSRIWFKMVTVVCIWIFFAIIIYSRTFGKYIKTSNNSIGIVLIGILIASASVEMIGLHTVFGAFLLGIILPASIKTENNKVFEDIHRFTMNFFTPLYFILIGFKVNFLTNFDLLLVSIVTLVACIGKICGVLTGSLLCKISVKEALVIGFGMNSRGAIEIILSSIALELKIIDQRIFVAFTSMAIITTVLSGPVMKILLSKHRETSNSNWGELIA